MSTSIKNRRRALLAGASGAILATVAVGNVAQAQTVVVDDVTLDALVNAHIAGGSGPAQTNIANITATADIIDGLSDTNGDTDGLFENDANSAPADAYGNRQGVSASLVTIGSGAALPDDGIAIVSQQLNTNAASITSTSASNDFGLEATDFTSGTLSASGNNASSLTEVNRGNGVYAMTINGTEPVGYTNLATANASVDVDLSGEAADLADLSGTLLISNVQIADSTSNSSANTTGNDFTMTVNSTDDNTVNATVALDDNNASSTFAANTRDASITLSAADANTSVTAAISSAQRYESNDVGTYNALTDNNTVVATIEALDRDLDDNDFVNSSLTVTGNTITSSATGNTGDAGIALADGLAYNTVAANAGSAFVDQLDIDEGLATGEIHADGGLVIATTQVLTTDGDLIPDALTSVTSASRVTADVQYIDDGSIDVSANRMTATTLGNDQTSSIASGAGSALFDASAVIVGRQEANTLAVGATASDSRILVEAGTIGLVQDSSITVDGNVQAASATGNTLDQSITLDAVAVNAGNTGQALVWGDLSAIAGESTTSAEGSVVIASQQGNVDAQVFATNTGASIYVDVEDDYGEDAQGTNVATTGNIQQAFAIGSDAGNSLSLSGVSVGSAAGIANVQTNDATSTVVASQDATVETYYDWNAYQASGEISGNSQSAIARGTVASNALNVDAQTITVDDGSDGNTNAIPGSMQTRVDAGYAVVSTQQVLADVTAETVPEWNNAYTMDVWGTANSSTLTLDGNTVLAQAQGTVAANSMSLEVGSLTSQFTDEMSEGVAGISNLQNVAGADITATARGNGNAVVLTDIGSDALSSDVSTSGNQIIAQADSSKATNSLTVDATSLSGLSSGNSDAYYLDDYASVNAQYAVSNMQLAGTGSVTATLRDAAGGAFTDSSAVVTAIGRDVTSSAVDTDSNLLQALAASNKATNTLSLDANSLTNVSAGAVNQQISTQDVSALVGFAGSAGAGAFSVAGTVTTGVWTGDVSGLTEAELAAFIAAYNGQPAFNYDAVEGLISFGSVGDGALTLPVGASDGVWNNGGVVATIGGTIDASAVSVDANRIQGSAIGNSATNSVSVAGTTVDGADGTASGNAWTSETGQPEAYAQADVTLASEQDLLSGSSSTTEVYGTFGIIAALDQGITDSSLSVSGNSQYGEAIGNTVTNTLAVSGTDLATGATSGALVSEQDGEYASISALSDMQVMANVASSASVIAIDGNANNALGVVNNAVNTLNASAVNSATTTQGSADGDTLNGSSADAGASYVLVNAQNADGVMTTTATSNIYNVDGSDLATSGVVNGSVSMSSNLTRAEATANRSTNTANLSATNLGSTAALINQQDNDTATTADASSYVSFAVNGTSALTEAADGSSVTVEGNTTVALARGNSSTNTLNYMAGANYTAQVAAGVVDGNGNSATADAALLNDQHNSGAIVANATGSTSIVLNADLAATDAAALNASLSNSNNTVASYAYGNSAANTVMLAALNTGTPNVAASNQQFNSGAITARTTSVNFNMTSTGTVNSGSFRNNGNVASATAVGNSSITVIGGQ